MKSNHNDYNCIFLGCIGDDEHGKNITSYLNKDNILPLLECKQNVTTSKCGVGIHEKERTLLTDICASKELDFNYVKSLTTELENVDYFLIEGYFLLDKPEIIYYLLEYFHGRNKQILLTFNSPWVVDKKYTMFKEIADKSEILFFNDKEAEAFAKNTLIINIDLKDVNKRK